MHDASGGDDTPKKIEDGFPQVSWLEASATAEQAATTAAAHRGYMMAGVERMYRNLEAVEHAQNAIERLPSIHHQVELMSNLMDSVNDLEAAFGDLHSQGITRGVINSAAKFVDARELEAASDGQVKDPSRMPASSTDGADEGISTGMQTSLLESGATVEQGLSAGVSAAAEAHRATMMAGADRLGRNIESVEQIRDAIMSLAREEDRVSLIEQLSDAVGFLKEGYKELEAKGTRFSQSLADR